LVVGLSATARAGRLPAAESKSESLADLGHSGQVSRPRGRLGELFRAGPRQIGQQGGAGELVRRFW